MTKSQSSLWRWSSSSSSSSPAAVLAASAAVVAVVAAIALLHTSESATRFVDWQIARFLTPRDTPFSQIDKDSSEEATARGGGGGGGGKRDVCAIVLGFQLNRDGSPHAILRQRVATALQLPVTLVIFSGGHDGTGYINHTSEASVMTQLATSGLPSQPASSSEASPPLFYEEPRSTSTRTNAVNTLDLIAAEDICGAKLLIVTSRYNQRRAWRVFKKVVHLHHRTVDVEMVRMEREPTSNINLQFHLLREYLALVYYWFMGWI